MSVLHSVPNNLTHDAENQVSRPSISCRMLVFHKVLSIFVALAAKIVTSPDTALHGEFHACNVHAWSHGSSPGRFNSRI